VGDSANNGSREWDKICLYREASFRRQQKKVNFQVSKDDVDMAKMFLVDFSKEKQLNNATAEILEKFEHHKFLIGSQVDLAVDSLSLDLPTSKCEQQMGSELDPVLLCYGMDNVFIKKLDSTINIQAMNRMFLDDQKAFVDPFVD